MIKVLTTGIFKIKLALGHIKDLHDRLYNKMSWYICFFYQFIYSRYNWTPHNFTYNKSEQLHLKMYKILSNLLFVQFIPHTRSLHQQQTTPFGALRGPKFYNLFWPGSHTNLLPGRVGERVTLYSHRLNSTSHTF